MAPPDPIETDVAKFPLVGADVSVVQGLVAVIRRLAVAHSLAEVMDVTTHAARSLLQADGVTFVLREGDHCYYADEDAISPLWKGCRFPMSVCISGWCMEHGQAVAIPDIYQDPRIPHDAYRPTFVRSLAMAPVRQEEPIAAIGAYWSRPRQPTAAELELLQTIANAAALALACVQLREGRKRGLRRLLALLPRRRPVVLLEADRAAQPDANAIWLPRQRLPGWQGVLIGLGVTAVAWMIRGALEPLLGPHPPYALFMPAILIATVWGGRVAGLACMLAGGLAADMGHNAAWGGLEPSDNRLWDLLSFWLLSGFVILVTETMTAALRREAVLNRRLEVVSHELQHRIKNVITVAQALARQTSRGTSDIKEFERKYEARLEALAQAQILLAEIGARTTALSALVDRALAPFRSEGRLRSKPGPDVEVDEQLAVAITLILHELATNALKHGALSVLEGYVTVAWTVERGIVQMVWREHGGPPVAAPLKSGFGTRLLKDALPPKRGVVRLAYEPTGVRCEIELNIR